MKQWLQSAGLPWAPWARLFGYKKKHCCAGAGAPPPHHGGGSPSVDAPLPQGLRLDAAKPAKSLTTRFFRSRAKDTVQPISVAEETPGPFRLRSGRTNPTKKKKKKETKKKDKKRAADFSRLTGLGINNIRTRDTSATTVVEQKVGLKAATHPSRRAPRQRRGPGA